MKKYRLLLGVATIVSFCFISTSCWLAASLVGLSQLSILLLLIAHPGPFYNKKIHGRHPESLPPPWWISLFIPIIALGFGPFAIWRAIEAPRFYLELAGRVGIVSCYAFIAASIAMLFFIGTHQPKYSEA